MCPGAVVALQIAAEIEPIEWPQGADRGECVQRPAGCGESGGYQKSGSEVTPDIVQIASQDHGSRTLSVHEKIAGQQFLQLQNAFESGQPQVEVEQYQRPLMTAEVNMTFGTDCTAPLLQGNGQIKIGDIGQRKSTQDRIAVVALAQAHIRLKGSMA